MLMYLYVGLFFCVLFMSRTVTCIKNYDGDDDDDDDKRVEIHSRNYSERDL